ncbi:hypothetical protein [Streptomyces sp. NBC_00343]|uniref:hypothetical protein n=1 Tax=Streptomyces sp. NBC_00343 TaxID=2975719 RepID=UPI002E2BBAEE|nr:hypothetical protein [Streptomyces sp. NBC_00343]
MRVRADAGARNLCRPSFGTPISSQITLIGSRTRPRGPASRRAGKNEATRAVLAADVTAAELVQYFSDLAARLGEHELPTVFQSRTSMSSPCEPTRTVHDPGAVMETAVRHRAARKPRPASAQPRPWTLLGT